MTKLSESNLQTLLGKAVQFYCKIFDSTTEGKSLLAKFGITDAGIYGKRTTGYTDGSLLKALPEQGKVLEELAESGILRDGKEYFDGCVTFPVLDSDNRIVNIAGINSGGEHIYLPDLPRGCFNEAVTQTYSEYFRVDTILEVLSLEMAGITNAISGEVPDDVSCRELNLPECHTVNSYLLEYGAERLREFIESTPIDNKPEQNEAMHSDNGFKVKYGLRTYHAISIDKNNRKLKVTLRVEKSGKIHVDTVNLYSSKERRLLASDLTLSLDELPETINADLNKFMALCEATANKTVMPLSSIKATAMTPKDREDAIELGKSDNLIERILSDYHKSGLIGEEQNALLSYLCMTSRKMDNPLSLMILSSSGAGKSKLQDSCLKFCPPEEMLKLTNLSGKALFYMGRTSIKHKVLALEEEAGAEDASYALRNLITSDGLTTETTIRDDATGRLTTMQNHVEGPVAVIITTTKVNTDPETKSRFIVTSVSESKEQTEAILEAQRKLHTLDGVVENLEIESIRTVHRNFQRLLKPYKVVNPYASEIAYKDNRLQSRRGQPQYLGLINTVAFLRQLRKEIKVHNGVRYIEVDSDDIEIANKIAKEILAKALDDLSIPGRDLLEQIETLVDEKLKKLNKNNPDNHVSPGEITFTRRELCEYAGWKRSRLRIFLMELVDAEYVLLDRASNSRMKFYRLINIDNNTEVLPWEK